MLNLTCQSVLADEVILTGGDPLPSLSTQRSKSSIHFSGMLDLYYSYNFNNQRKTSLPTLADPGLPSGQSALRNFDAYHDAISLNYAEFGIQKVDAEVGFRIELAFGQSVEQVLLPFNHLDEIFKNIGQAFVSYNPSSLPRFSFRVGKMFTHIGFEDFRGAYNWQYSRSNLYALAVPDWHLGVNANYEIIPEKLKLSTFVYNGWNVAYNASGTKTIGIELRYTPFEGTWMDYDYIMGPELGKEYTERKTVHDICLQWTFNPAWALGISLLYGEAVHGTYSDLSGISQTVGRATWMGGTLAVKFNPTSKYFISPRFEVYQDAQGYTTQVAGGTTLGGVTLTQSYGFGQGLEGRLEFRQDSSSKPVFGRKDGSLSATQFTSTVGILYAL